MSEISEFEKERREVTELLQSGVFSRAPNLALLLEYICTKFFEGTADEIKEYTIAVEAFGRPPEFDQKRDSIVRVEAHRLRKRLKEFYEGPGAAHAIHIEVPAGQYTPRFIRNEQLAVAEPVVPNEVMEVPPSAVTETGLELVTEIEASMPAARAPEAPTVPKTSRWKWAIALAVVSALAVTVGALQSRKRPLQAAAPSANTARTTTGDEIRILAGLEQGSYVDSFEKTWVSDRYFNGGYTAAVPATRRILGTRDQRLFQSRRDGRFGYDIPLKPGVYELKLYFAETVFGDNNTAGGGETTRIFDVIANGKTLLPGFDVISDGGSATADVKVFKNIQPSDDGKLHLEFTPLTNSAFVNAIEIVPGIPDRLRPIRIVARDHGIRDSQGRYWDPDRYAQGGQIVARAESPVKEGEPELFRSERFGNINYVIPVPPGRYGVNLYFAELWFGPGMPGGEAGPGSRIFDILVDGVAAKRNFDIFRQAGGVGKTTTVSLHGVEPNHQGKITISLTPAVNYACINALEILDEGR